MGQIRDRAVEPEMNAGDGRVLEAAEIQVEFGRKRHHSLKRNGADVEIGL